MSAVNANMTEKFFLFRACLKFVFEICYELIFTQTRRISQAILGKYRQEK
jgi:hypothetical protein